MCKILEFYDVGSDIITWFLLITVPLLQQHIYISIGFLLVNRLQFFPHIFSCFTIDNMQKWFLNDVAIMCWAILLSFIQ